MFYVHPQEGLTGLHLAAMHDDVDIAQELIGKGCPIDSQDEKVCSTTLPSHSHSPTLYFAPTHLNLPHIIHPHPYSLGTVHFTLLMSEAVRV